jgi:MinD-like ATPase involved in chromosome partitioning or flagellar assembly
MALVNIGTWLARNGRRVLLVDFDLESPGITHYALPNMKSEQKGVVDYLFEMSHGKPPATLEGYYFESFTDKGGGRLYVMPAGKASTHVSRFEKLDLGHLYQKGDGYLILENLKGLWKREIIPDYVFIDSRTGYNEVAGICTRQLPDAVIATFIPSPQNLNGLREIVDQIRAQNKQNWRSEIKVHFLASSIPSIDDEDGSIADAVARSKQVLEFEQLLGSVSYIPSAAHLNQTVFTLEKEQSRLAKNFATVARAITMINPADPEGAKNYLDRLLDRDHALMRTLVSARLAEELKEIGQRHSANVDVMFRLARVRLRQGEIEDAVGALDAVLEIDPNVSEARLLRATLRIQSNDTQAAVADLQSVLGRTDLDVIQVNRAARALADAAPEALGDIQHTKAYASLDVDERASLLLNIVRSRVGGLDRVVKAIESLLDERITDEGVKEDLRRSVILHRIHQGNFDDARALLGKRPTDDSDAVLLFNYAVAEWGWTGNPPADLFAVLASRSVNAAEQGANHLQCFGLAHAVTGDKELARTLLESARQMALRAARPEFSAWTYSLVTPTEFAAHVAEMLQALNTGEMVLPPVIGRRRGG